MSLVETRCILFLLVLAIGFSSCDEAEEIPAYLYIEDFGMQTDPLDEGSNSQNYRDVWVYIDQQPAGIFELPASVPVLRSGETTVSLFPGIYENGISATRVIYPMTTAFDQTVTLNPLEIDTLSPVVGYKEECNFKMVADFEFGNPFDSSSPDMQLSLTENEQDVFEGNKSMKMRSTLELPNFQILSNVAYELPVDGRQTYLEFNYKCDAPFTILVKAFGDGTASFEVISVREKEDWNKFYVHLTPSLGQLFVEGFNGPFQIVFAGGLKDDMESANWYWDNVKLIHL